MAPGFGSERANDLERHHDVPKPRSGNRVCDEEDCSTLLSIYNASSRCSLHGARPAEGRRPDRTARRVPLATGLVGPVRSGPR